MTRYAIINRIRVFQQSLKNAKCKKAVTQATNSLRRELTNLLMLDGTGAQHLARRPCFALPDDFLHTDYEWLLQENFPVHEFTRKVKAKGWTLRALAVRWGMSSKHLSTIAANPRPHHWDALAGIEDLTKENNKINKRG
jgi:hypothetical protein